MNDHQPITNFLNSISSTINTTIIKTKQPILIAISGGQDSICLFFIFIQLKKQWKWAFGILYCNHLWQKKSLCTGSLILKISYLFNISIYYVTTSDIIFNEENSRDWRYRIFYRLIFFYNYKTVTTGHTLSDKIETILFQFIRGTSPENLVSLNIAKYFSSNKKFTRNPQIKHIHFYPKRRFNLVPKPFQFIFLKKMVDPVNGLNVLLRKYNTNLSQQDWQGRYIKVMINLDPIFQKNCFNKSCMSQKFGYSIRGSRCFSFSAKRKVADFKPLVFRILRKTYNQVANTPTWNSKLDHRSRSYLIPSTCSFEQKIPCKPCPNFHENYRLILKLGTTKISSKTIKKFQKNNKQSVWKLCRKTTVTSCYKKLNQSMYSVLNLKPTWTTRQTATFQSHSLGLLGYEATRYKIQTKDKFIIEPSKDRKIQSSWLGHRPYFELTKYTLVRPILLLNRFDLKKLLQFFNLPIYPDRTNQKKIYRRNRIRKELLPTLKFFFNPQIEISFIHFSEISSAEQFYLNFLFHRLINEFYVSTATKFSLNTGFFVNIPIAFQRKLIKQLLADCTNKDICFVNIDKILKLLQKPMREASWLHYNPTGFSRHKVPGLDTVGVEINETFFGILSCNIPNSFRALYLVRDRVYSPNWVFLNQIPEAKQQSHITYLRTLHKNSYSLFRHKFLFNYNTNLYFSRSLYYRLLSNQPDPKCRLFVHQPVFDKSNKSGSCLIYRNLFVGKTKALNSETIKVSNYFINKNRFDFAKLIQDLYQIQRNFQSRENSMHTVATKRLKHSQISNNSRLLFFFDIFYFQGILIILYFNVGVFFF